MNMDWIVSKKKEDFLERDPLRDPIPLDMIEKIRWTLVNDKETILPEGLYIVEKALKQPPMSHRHTSSY